MTEKLGGDNGGGLDPASEEMRKRIQERIDQESAGETTDADGPEQRASSKLVHDCLKANELGDGMLYSALLRGKFLYVKNSGQWYYWDEHVWRRDDLDSSLVAVEDVVDRYRLELSSLNTKISDAIRDQNEDKQKEYRKIQESIYRRISKLRSERGRQNCLKFAAANRESLSISGSEFNQDPWVLACANGVLDLRTGELRDGRPDEYISKRSPIVWSGIESAAKPWDECLLQIHDGNAAKVAYLQRLFGYGITGLRTQRIFPVLHGRGQNGKGLMMEMISKVMGDYAGPVPSEMLLDNNRNASAAAPTPEIMALKGLRLAIASETDENRRFSAAKVKWLTGGDPLTGRGLHDRFLTTFLPTHTLVLLTNDPPSVSGTDYGFWERCFLIPFPLSFVDRDPDPAKKYERRADKDLEEKLYECAPGILAWLVKGCLLWQKQGMDPPDEVLDATGEYQRSENMMEDFFRDCCEDTPEQKINSSELYHDVFCKWYEKEYPKRKSPTHKRFGTLMKKSDRFHSTRISGKVYYLDLAIKEEFADGD